MNEFEKLKQIAAHATITNAIVIRWERVLAQENASSHHALEAASFVIANALSRFPDKLEAWREYARRIEKAISEGFDRT